METLLSTCKVWLLSLLQNTKVYFFMQPGQQILKKPTSPLQILIVAWAIEWLLIIEYLLDEWLHTLILLAVRVPTLLLICFLYWFWLWTMSVWRRTQFGKFTRGERKLWAKALTAFWVAELVTAASFVIIFGCLSWGPAPLVPRIFWVPRKGIILEVIVYSYILMIAYIAKMTLKWNSWRSQVVLSCVILIILSYVLWKDVLLLLTRENLYSPQSARWRNLRTNTVVYTLSHEWWTTHITTRRAPHARHNSLIWYLVNNEKPDFNKLPQYSQYEMYNMIDDMSKNVRGTALCPLLSALVDYSQNLQPLSAKAQLPLTYPRRVGFVPKRLSLWHLLVVLKMWHHLILVLWWSLYIYKLVLRQKTAYAFLGSCAFNVMCCLLLALIVYSLSFFQRWELFLKFKPVTFNLHRGLLCTHLSFDMVQSYFTTWYFENATFVRNG